MTRDLERHIGTIPFDNVLHWRDARKVWIEYRQDAGRKAYTPLFTPPRANPKTAKNDVPTYILHLAPAAISGWQICRWSTAGCRAACLNTAGRGRFTGTQEGRILKTQFLADNPEAFFGNLYHEIDLAVGRHGSGNVGIRLNGTSDIRWERIAPWLFETFPSVQFYDYTKAPISQRTNLPANYQLTASASEKTTSAGIRKLAETFGRCTVVLDIPTNKDGAGKYLAGMPVTFAGLPVVDGDLTDWRLEPGPVVIGLRAKGDAIGDTSGFVRAPA